MAHCLAHSKVFFARAPAGLSFLLLPANPFRYTFPVTPTLPFHGPDVECRKSPVNDLPETQHVEAEEPLPPPPSHGMFSGVRLLLSRVGVKRQYLIAGAAVVAAAASVGAFFVHDFLFDEKNLISLGYLGVFIFTFLGAATIFLPSASSLVVIGAGAWLNPFIVGLVAGTGSTLGELTGYAIGYQGGEFLERRSRLFQRAKDWMERRGNITLFLLSVIPNPVFDTAGLAAGAIKFPLKRFFAIVWAGKTIQAIVGAYLGERLWIWASQLVDRILS